jgi:hypothetical protein
MYVSAQVIRRSVYLFSEGYSPVRAPCTTRIQLICASATCGVTLLRNVCAQEELFRRDHEDIMHTHALDYVRHRLPALEPSVLRDKAVGSVMPLDSVDLDTGEEEAEHEEEARRFGHVKVPIETVVYDRRPGNHLDVQVRLPYPSTILSLCQATTQVHACENVQCLTNLPHHNHCQYLSSEFVLCVSSALWCQIKSGKFAHPMSEQHLYDVWHKAGPERGRQITEAIAAQEEYLGRKIRALTKYERQYGVQVL